MKILLIMPNFFGVTKHLIDGFKDLKCEVTYYCGTIKKTFFQTIKINFNKNNLNSFFANKIEKDLIDKFDSNYFDKLIIFYAGEPYWTRNIVQKLKNHFKCEFVYYAWDSIANMYNVSTFINLFDRKYTFDYEDKMKYGINFLPLFYTTKYNDVKITFTYLTIMSYYISKDYGVKLARKTLEKVQGGKLILVINHKIRFYIYKIRYFKKFRKYKLSDFIYHQIPSDECDSMFGSSFCIVDIPLSKQSGLTIRTIDAIYNKKKLITTNKAIKKYNFYSENNIFVVDENHTVIPDSFFNTKFDENYCISESYSIHKFCNILLNYDLALDKDYLN